MNSEFFMRLAIKQAQKCRKSDDVPVGAVIVKNGETVSLGRNRREERKSAVLHAEIDAINGACAALGSRNLSGCTIYVTLEPCPMCAGAILMSRIDKVVFGAYEENFGAAGSQFNLFYDYKIGRDVKFCGGVMENECKRLMTDFFKEKRRQQ